MEVPENNNFSRRNLSGYNQAYVASRILRASILFKISGEACSEENSFPYLAPQLRASNPLFTQPKKD